MPTIMKLALFLFLQKCVENSRFDISDAISDTSSFYTTRGLEQQSLGPDDDTSPSTGSEPLPPKPLFTLAKHIAAELEILMHKITQTFVKIGQTSEGQRTLHHIYNELFDISSNEISQNTLNYIMQGTLQVMQDPMAAEVIIEFFLMIRDLMKRDLTDWYFVLPFLHEINGHPVPIKMIHLARSEMNYVLENEDRKKAFEAAFNLLLNGFASGAGETLKTTPVPSTTLQPPDARPVKIETSETTVSSANPASAEQGAKTSAKRVITIPATQVEQVTEMPIKQVQSNQIGVEQATTIPVETVTQNPTAPESTTARVLRRVKSLPSYFKQSTSQQV